MKDLKVLFVLDIDRPLNYRIRKLIKFDDKYYKISNCYTDDLTKCFYTITEENKLLETIYKDKVIVFRQVVDNVYEPKDKYKTLLKTKN